MKRYDPRLEYIEACAAKLVELEYSNDVVAHNRNLEDQINTDPDMMDLQPEIQWYMRPYLIDFLIDSHYSMRLQPETLFLAISILDRYCSVRVVFKKHYQLVGCTALWIAAKYEEKKSRIPQLKELCRLCCGAYEEDMFLQMERHVLSTLEWSIGLPTVESFLSPLLAAAQHTTSVVGHVARYLCELSLFHRCFLGYPPSTIATAAHAMAQYMLGHLSSLPSGLTCHQIQCINYFTSFIKTPSASLTKKYSKPAYGQAAIHVQNILTQQAQQQALAMPPTPPPVSMTMLTPPPPLSSGSGASSPYTPESPTNSDHLTPPHTPSSMAMNRAYAKVQAIDPRYAYPHLEMDIA
uniref:ARAD1C34320p n=1 Tax=Blastobotrys adeninivorans TaxID=409370 RepID=A0A060T344_BLAAD